MGFFDSKSTTKPDMPGYADKFYRTLFKKMDSAFAQGPHVYNKSTVPGFSQSTKAAFGGMKDLAGSNSAVTNEDGTVTYNGMSGNLQDIMSNGGFTQGQLDTMGGMRGLIDNPGLAEMINGNGLTGEQNQAYSSLQDTVYRNNAAFQDQFDRGGLTADQQLVADRYRDDMNADFSLEANPAYASVRERALKEQQMALDANAAKSGRYGGGSSQTILAREQGNLGANMDVAQYDKWKASRDAAAGGLAGLSQTGFGNQLGISTAQQQGLGSIADMGQLGVDNRNSAISLKSGLQNNLFNAEKRRPRSHG
ncbi:MAG: hypothetical protein KL863_07405 [Rhizobium sp.]|nr:hypothetical protein [Rhizobium sp.]